MFFRGVCYGKVEIYGGILVIHGSLCDTIEESKSLCAT